MGSFKSDQLQRNNSSARQSSQLWQPSSTILHRQGLKKQLLRNNATARQSIQLWDPSSTFLLHCSFLGSDPPPPPPPNVTIFIPPSSPTTNPNINGNMEWAGGICDKLCVESNATWKITRLLRVHICTCTATVFVYTNAFLQENQPTRELISAQKTSHKQSNKDTSCLW